jgi:hypothetical protein
MGAAGLAHHFAVRSDELRLKNERSRWSALGAMLPIPEREQLRRAAIRDASSEALATVFRRAEIAHSCLLVGAAPLLLGLNVLGPEIKTKLGLP